MLRFLKQLFEVKKMVEKPKFEKNSIENLIYQLEESSYFQYASSSEIPEIKNELIDSILMYGVLGTSYDDQKLHPKCHRLFHLDGEDLYEQDGFQEQIKFMKTYFEKTGLQLNFEQYYEVYEEGLTHWFVLNGKKYEVFKDFDEYGWEEAAAAFAYILNEQFEIQNKPDRAYLIDGGNDGQLFLANPLHVNLLIPFLDINYQPKLPLDWWSQGSFTLPFTTAE